VATFVKLSSGNWKAVIRKQGWPTVTKTFRTKRDAEDWARTTEDEIVRGIFIHRGPAEKLTLKAALQRYLREITPTKRASTAERERKRAKILMERLGGYALAALNAEVIAKYRDKRLEEGKSASTVRLELALLSHLYTIAIKEWRVGLIYNPVANIRKPSPGEGRNRRLSIEEEKKLLAACARHTNPMLGWIVRLAIETGMRAGEIKSLRRSQVDLNRRVIRLTETKNGSARTVPLTKTATEVMRAALDNPVRPIDTDLVFFGEPGRDSVRKPYEFKPAWHRIIRELKLDNFRFHDLRHEAVSRLVELGLSDQEVSAISGHKSMQMLKRYTHLRSEDLVSKLDALS